MGDWMQDNAGWIIVAVLMLFIAAIAFCFNHDNEIFNRNMKECIGDGHKEYECRSMLESRRSTAPIVIPIVR